MYKGMLAMFLLLISNAAFAGKIDDFFSDGAFGVQWGSTIDEVRELHPKGTAKEYVGIQSYIVPHSTPVLKIEREDTDITFTFNSEGKLHAIGVSFEGNDIAEAFSSLKSNFGENEPLSDSPRIAWPQDGNIKMYLVSIPSGFSVKPVLTIENVAPSSEASKDALGFN